MGDRREEYFLPLWATVAFIARCARRYLDQFNSDIPEPISVRTAVTDAVRLAEARASAGGGENSYEGYLELEGQFFDNYDIYALQMALRSYIEAARNTHTDLSEDSHVEQLARRNFAAISLASLALGAAFPEEIESDRPPTCKDAMEWAVYGDLEIESSVSSDFTLLLDLYRKEQWGNEAGISPLIFGPLWPNGRPKNWPTPNLTFRPQARIIRTIGDRLISGPEAAVIELVKNSYDADATTVRITFLPPLRAGDGQIIFEDDGHGMTLSHIQEKWMEPATSDKKQRKQSPKGRRLLGSKGIGRFAAARLGEHLELTSTAPVPSHHDIRMCERTRIKLNWEIFDQVQYLDDVSFPVETEISQGSAGTSLKICRLRDTWTEAAMMRLHYELRSLISPSLVDKDRAFRIFLDLSRCTRETCEFDGLALLGSSGGGVRDDSEPASDQYEVKPFPILEACDYAVEGIFDEQGSFDGTITIRRAGHGPESIRLTVPLKEDEDQCGIVVVRLSIFDREATSIRSTAEAGGFGHLGIRDARKLLDSIAGVSIYRENFRIRPYGDGENDWLTLDAKRVQNPSMKIGRNQVAGMVLIDEEDVSRLLERSSREGLEENGSFRRLQSLILALLAREVEPRRRKYRIATGLETRNQSGFRDALQQAELPWAQKLLNQLPEARRAEAEKEISRESERLTGYLKELEERQAQLEAQVTLGLIIGEVMHQGNTPLAFIETESARLQRWWPNLFTDSTEAKSDRAEVPKMLNGIKGSSTSLRNLFNALRPLAGTRRGEPQNYSVRRTIDDTIYLFKSKADGMGIEFKIDTEIDPLLARGYPSDLTTALTNLIDNAMYWLHHFRISPAEIAITTGNTQADRVTIFIQDNGPGVSEDFRDQLFDVGFTLKPNGTGLGLSIAKEAIFRSGGELYLVDSNVGAKFAITLPCS